MKTAFDAARIPAELRSLSQWVAWRVDERDGEKTKVPVNARTRRAASCTDAETWATFDIAARFAKANRLGVGFVVTTDDPFLGVDLDKCIEDKGRLEKSAADIVATLNSYTEITPSGRGLRIFVRATKPGDRCRTGRTEMYDRERFFTLTGNVLPGAPTQIADRQDEIDTLYQRLFPPRRARTHRTSRASGNGHDLPDAELIERAKRARNGARFTSLWAGDWSGYPSQSEADQALCNLLTFWTGADAERIDRLFRQSGLHREKWERQDYRQRTINAAIDSTDETYNGAGRAAGEAPREAPELTSLDTVVNTFRRWLHLPDPAPLLALLGTIAANRMNGDPVWLMLVGPPGGGKTEILSSVVGLPHTRMVGTLTEPALLSGTPKRDKASGAKGGLLREIGDFGIIILKDFTSILSLHRDSRAGVLAALREIYDGHWVRLIGTDGGRTLEWHGKLGLVAGCTPAIDSHHAVVSAMGERFIFCRLGESDAVQGLRALEHVGRESEMRRELSEVITGLFSSVEIPQGFPTLDADTKRRLVAVACLAVRCRSAVDRDAYKREIDLVPEPEAPARLALTLARLQAGMRLLGVGEHETWRVVTRCALDSMPKLRRTVFGYLLARDGETPSTTEIAETIGYPTQTTRRACEDLTAHRIASRHAGGEGKADRWSLSAWAREQYAAATFPEMSDGDSEGTFPEMSDGDSSLFNKLETVRNDKSGKVPSGRENVFWNDAREDV